MRPAQVRLLAQVADGQTLAAHQEAGVAGEVAGQQAQQRALARAVRPHKPDTAVVVDLPRQLGEDRLLDVGDADAVKVYSNHGAGG
ncbi:MAG: hypothetical protein R2844_20065 [Caldilineales bacterium]